MSTVWFTSDLHLGHKLVAELRGYESVTEHDDAVCANWAERVGPKDSVWVLGDVDMRGLSDDALERLLGLPGIKDLVAGNHDACHPMHRQAHKKAARYLQVFRSVQSAARVKVSGRDVLLSHFPYTADRGYEARYPQWRLPDEGRWLLHGHTHSADRKTSAREIHVGLDAWSGSPVRVDEVAAMVSLQEAVEKVVGDAWNEGIRKGLER